MTDFYNKSNLHKAISISTFYRDNLLYKLFGLERLLSVWPTLLRNDWCQIYYYVD